MWGSYVLVFRFGLLSLAFSVGTVIVLGAIKQAVYHPFPHAVFAGLVQIITVGVLSYCCVKKLVGQGYSTQSLIEQQDLTYLGGAPIRRPLSIEQTSALESDVDFFAKAPLPVSPVC